MSEMDSFYYNQQLRSYLLQFMAIFAGMKVQVGKTGDTDPRVITVPIKNASKDRVVASIKSENTQNKPVRLPILSAHIVNVELAPEMRKGVGQTRRQTYLPTGGLVPDDLSVVEQRMPVPYRATMELGIWASNQDQHYQIIEQILMLFDPNLQIQTSDKAFDWAKLTIIELTDIRFDENVPSGVDRRTIQSTLTFQLPIYIACPTNIRNNFIKDIFIRVGAVSQIAHSSEDIIADLDGQNIDYEPLFSADDLDIT